jgi:hypothetical protein
VRFDAEALDREVSRALMLGSASTVYEGVLAPVLQSVGDLWLEGAVSVAQEHMASHVIGRTAMNLVQLVQPQDAGRKIVLACFADEDHVLTSTVAIRFYRETKLVLAWTPLGDVSNHPCGASGCDCLR